MFDAGKTTRLAAMLVAALVLAVAVSACGISVAEDGPHAVRSREVARFDRIEVRGSTEVTVERGSHAALRLEGGANRIHDLRTYVEGDTLVIEQEDTSGAIDIGDDPVRVVARAPRVDEVRIDGSGKVALRGLGGAHLGASVYGSGEVRTEGPFERLDAKIDGSGEVFYTGDPVVSEDISGSGRVERR
jgi:hypothetical protein